MQRSCHRCLSLTLTIVLCTSCDMDELLLGLPPGTLYRDNRTTRHKCCDTPSEPSLPAPPQHRDHEDVELSLLPHPNTPTNYTRTHIRRKYFPRFSEIVFWVALFCTMQETCNAAPARRSVASKSHRSSQPLWINPCGMMDPNELMPTETEAPLLSDKELLSQIIPQAKTALRQTSGWKDDYVAKIFNVDIDEHHAAWMNSHYDWLPNKNTLDKSLGEPLSQEYLKKFKEIEFKDSLVIAFEHLQKFAVALEAVASDHQDQNSEFSQHFLGMELTLRSVLCELQVAIIEKGATRRPDVTREIMADEYRNLEGSSRDLRDWIILRDYMNMLEYLIQMFEYYKDAILSS